MRRKTALVARSEPVRVRCEGVAARWRESFTEMREMTRTRRCVAVAGFLLMPLVGACAGGPNPEFEALQARGEVAMGVDQYTSVHRFDALPDGGRIELRAGGDDSTEVATIRTHLAEIARAFREGDFSTPAFVHMREMPGTRTMAERRDLIRFEYSDLPRGGEVRIVTTDPTAIAAIHEFMAAQRHDHRAGGHH